MKQSQNARKQRGRSASRKTGKSNNGGGNRNEPKVRGNPKQLLEKYKNQAREAKQAGDRVMAEYYYQFADHYQRVLNEMGVRSSGGRGDDNKSVDGNVGDDQQAQNGGQRKQNRSRRSRNQNNEQQPEETTAEPASDASGVDPSEAEQPVEVHPELDLDGTAAEESEKPKRRRAPARRRSPRKPAADASAEAPVAADAAPAEAADSSGDNEAA